MKAVYSGDAHRGDQCRRIVIEGSDITNRCRAVVEFDNGILHALCYLKRNGDFVVNRKENDVMTETLIGRGHAFRLGGCCGLPESEATH